MYARHVRYHARPGSRDVLLEIIEAMMPEVRQQPGFIDMLMLIGDSTGDYVGISRWQTREDADRVTTTILPKLMDRLGALLHAAPEVRIYSVYESQA